MWQYKNNNELYHFGVLGMKWGVRKGSTTTTAATRSKKTSSDDDSEIKFEIKNKKVKHLLNGAIGVIGSKAIFSVASKTASLAGKQRTAKFLSTCGDMAMFGGAIATSAKLISDK